MTYKFNSNCLKVSSIAFFLLVFQAGFSQKNSKEYSTGPFKQLNEALNSQQKVLGKEYVALVWMDTLVFRKESPDFGARSQVEIGDASSWLTAALVMQFVDEGKLALDDKVSKYLPVFAKYGKNYITLRTCLTHMTGIQSDPGKLKKMFEKKKFASLDDEVADYASKEIQTNPGTEFRYSNMGISIAGRVLEVITKKKFDQLAQQRLFRPLGMRNTTFSNTELGAINPSNGARSTAEDYIKFLAMLLNKGSFKDQKVLSEGAVNQLLSLQILADKIKYAPKGAQGYTYALGSWVLESRENGAPVTLSALSFNGVMPMLDVCRRYAVLFFPKATTDDPKTETYINLKKGIDDMLPGARKGCE